MTKPTVPERVIRAYPRGKLRLAVLAYLRTQAGPRSCPEIARFVQKHPADLRDTLKRMVSRNDLTRTPDGRYQIRPPSPPTIKKPKESQDTTAPEETKPERSVDDLLQEIAQHHGVRPQFLLRRGCA